jgi:carbonic anhydrase/acetyltransferase-like protein (isoleucine patch superfamily)
MSWRDLSITPLVECCLFASAIAIAWYLRDLYDLSFFAACLVFYAAVVALTLVALKIIRVLFPIRPGIYTFRRHPWTCYVWNLHEFLCGTNLNRYYFHGLVPFAFKKFFYRLLGAKMGNGIVAIGGLVLDPSLIAIEENVIVGAGSVLSCHLITVVASEDTLILGRISIKEGTLIGGNVQIMPGVTVGEHAMINNMAFVPLNTIIPPYEVWGGNPAKKISDIPRRSQP